MGEGRLRIALVFGGRSGEHAVSVVSARSVDRALDRDRYEVVAMAIDRNGRWADGEDSAKILAEAPTRTEDVAPFSGRHRVDPRLLDEHFDVAIPVLHGPYGEDGTIQGLFEMLDLSYVGCDVASSAACMDKIYCKGLLRQAGYPTPDWCEIHRPLWASQRDATIDRCLQLGLPLFVKPARLGSSVGISKVGSTDGLGDAVDVALGHGRRVLVERGLDAREIEVPVLGNDQPRAAVPGEVVPGHEFYDYDDKYIDSTCQLLAPAPIDRTTAEAAQKLAVDVFRHLGCSGMARVDLFLERASDRLWVNEVNTIPGFTSISMYPKLWQASGLEYPELIDELIRLALE
jgi:D-alanine-D-alanine ligase